MTVTSYYLDIPVKYMRNSYTIWWTVGKILHILVIPVNLHPSRPNIRNKEIVETKTHRSLEMYYCPNNYFSSVYRDSQFKKS